MASMFMRLGDHSVKGAATISIESGEVPHKDGWIAIRSLSWNVNRNLKMNVGDARERSVGTISMTEIMLTKEMCGASEVILSRLYVPGENGDTIELLITKDSREGKGADVILYWELKEAIVSEYGMSIADAAVPYESMALVYNRIKMKHWTEEPGGKLTAGGDVTYDLATAVAMSHAIKKI